MAKDAEEATLREAPYVHKAAQVASITHKWDQREEQSNVMVNIALLGIDPESIRADSRTHSAALMPKGDCAAYGGLYASGGQRLELGTLDR